MMGKCGVRGTMVFRSRGYKIGRNRSSYALGIKAMKNGWWKVANWTQGSRENTEKSNGLSAERAACGLMREHVVESGLALLVCDIVLFEEDDKGIDVLEPNETLLKPEKKPN